ncbi:hypothetical protein [Clostridium taeniosporum]|uniref:TATA-box binding protein n=1 Tax=Clostridium taeniosporum TaxID=394958 RepID=A0A1D7XHQ5_9CLOT|nr:hypothetical protein [Clostridium taeniosporum]AOR22609.1 hypothetical protein BGI42_02270 [Clostridium taeniosporum]
MKFKYCLFFLILFLIFNISSISAKEISNDYFYNLEKNITNESKFEENGIKLQFKTKKSIEKEHLFLKQYLISRLNGKYTNVDDKSFKISNEKINAWVNLWNIKDYTYVEITLININSEYNTKHLEELVENIKKTDIKDIQIFLYYKGMIDNSKSLEDFRELKSLEDLNVLNINNGYTGTGNSKLGRKMNFALVRYNDKSHIIIGTPIIFTTY